MHPKKLDTSHFFTVDVEEYFHAKAMESVVKRDEWLLQPSRVANSVDALLGSLDRHRAHGTFFVLGWLADQCPQIVRAIAAAGHEVASHGYWHDPVTRLDLKGFREDVRSSKQALEDLLGCAVLGYRAPNFSIVPGGEWAFDVLLEEGYRYDSSLFPVRRPGYGYPTAQRAPHLLRRPAGTLAEFPLATTKVFAYNVPAAGGGYLRQFPYGVIRRAFQEASDRGEPATFYIHPWEVDPEQPRLPVSSVTRIRHYRGLEGTLARIERLLGEFRFDAIATYLPHLEASATAAKVVGAA
ncbi:MAG: XrtA system polysaccharide deacetylase [Gemmatimonadaceae bacterium]|jgi:polysaccharide deacetylase family protein (PEP-CTERM system associated)